MVENEKNKLQRHTYYIFICLREKFFTNKLKSLHTKEFFTRKSKCNLPVTMNNVFRKFLYQIEKPFLIPLISRELVILRGKLKIFLSYYSTTVVGTTVVLKFTIKKTGLVYSN